MALANPKSPAAPTLPIKPTAAGTRAAERDAEWWVETVKWIALAVFVAVPFFAFFAQSLAGRVVWTMVVASIPLFIVLVGYHRWRRICPLAFFAQLPVRLRRPGARRASPRLEANYYYVALGVFFFSLWIRLIATNGDGRAIALFFVLLSLAALVVGLIYTGKTWCNYICPLSFIEKIYTEPHGLRETSNSQCVKCTACKKACPDINEENGYWKEVALPAKRFAYFAFPGLVFAFYFYYYLQAGTWDYYFGGSWTNQPEITRTAFLPGYDATTAGFYFFPQMPRALAALLTLAALALLSFLLFSQAERLIGNWLRRREPDADMARARHVMLTVAAFTAFITFYTFAGAPTLRRLPWAPHFFLIVVVLTATLFLARRLLRTQKGFAEETLARSIVKRWPWAEVAPPKDLREAFITHTILSRENARGYQQMLDSYKEAVREALANGYVTREEVQLLESLRSQMQIKQADHEKIMSALAEEERAMLADPTKQVSAEKRLQLQSYARALAGYMEQALATDSAPDDALIRQLRAEYRVTREEHNHVLDELLGGERGITARLAEELAAIERAARTVKALAAEPSPTHDFLRDLLRRTSARATRRLLQGLRFAPDGETSRDLRERLGSVADPERASAIEQLRAGLSPAAAEPLLSAYRQVINEEAGLTNLTAVLRARTRSLNPYVRAVALYALGERDAADAETLARLSQDEHTVVRETAKRVREKTERASASSPAAQDTELFAQDTGLTTIEKMIALRAAPIFSTLDPEELAELARQSAEDFYQPNEALCIEGEPGNEVFIIVAGEVEALRRDNGTEHVVGKERAGGLIGEMAVLDPAPRSATVRAAAMGARVLRLHGEAFRAALQDDPAIASGVIRTLARRLRQAQ